MLNTRGLYLPGGSPAGQISSAISPSKTLYAGLDPDLGPMTNREAAGRCNSKFKCLQSISNLVPGISYSSAEKLPIWLQMTRNNHRR